MEKGNEANSQRFLPGQNIRICDGDDDDDDDNDDDDDENEDGDGAILRTHRLPDLQRKFSRVIT